MTLLVPNNGEGDMLAYIVNKAPPEDLVLRLFQNNVTPSETDTAGTYTEASFTGYAAAPLTGASWTITEAPSNAAYAQQTFTSSANQAQQLIYGYYLTRASSGRIAWAELFSDGPYSVNNNGDAIKVTPTITLD